MQTIELEPMEHPGMQAAHEVEIELYLRLAAQVEARNRGELADADAAIDTTLVTLLSQMEAHFGEEDRMMLALRFPPYPAHAAEHRQVLDEMRNSIARWQVDRDLDALACHVLGDHLVWMKRHVATMDYLTARFINMASAAR